MARLLDGLFALCLVVAWGGAVLWRPRFVMEPFGVGVELWLVPLAFALGVLALLGAAARGRVRSPSPLAAALAAAGGGYVLLAPVMPDALRHAGFGFSLLAVGVAWAGLRGWLKAEPRRAGLLTGLLLAGLALQAVFAYLQHSGHSWENVLKQAAWQPAGDAMLKVLEALPGAALPSGTLGTPNFLAWAVALALPALAVGAGELRAAWLRGLAGVAALACVLTLFVWAPPVVLLLAAAVAALVGLSGLLVWRGVPGVGLPCGAALGLGAFGLFRAFVLERAATVEALRPLAAVRRAGWEPLLAVGPFGLGLGGWRETGYGFLQRVYPAGMPDTARLWLETPAPGVQLWLELGFFGVAVGVVALAVVKWRLHSQVAQAPARVVATFVFLGLMGFGALVLPWWTQPALWAWGVLVGVLVWPLGAGADEPAGASPVWAVALAVLLAGVAVADVSRWVLPAYRASEAHFIGYRIDVVRPGSVRGAPAYEVAAGLERQPSASRLAAMRSAQTAEQWADVWRVYEQAPWQGPDGPAAAGVVATALEKLDRRAEAMPLLDAWLRFLPAGDARRAELQAQRDRLAL